MLTINNECVILSKIIKVHDTTLRMIIDKQNAELTDPDTIKDDQVWRLMIKILRCQIER